MSPFIYLRFLMDIPRFLGIDRAHYGPFVSGSVASIPSLNAKILINRGACVPHDPLLFYDSGFKKTGKYSGLTDSECDLISYFDNSVEDLESICNLQLGLGTKSSLKSCSSSRISHKIWVLPGQESAGIDCNTVKFGLKCGHCGSKKVIYYHCDKPECPSCRDNYAFEHGSDLVDRLLGCNSAYLDAGVKLGWFKHWVLSPPQVDAVRLCETHEGYKLLRSSVTKLLKDSGVKGGSIIFHYYRIKKEVLTGLRGEGYGVGKGSNGSLWEGVLSDVLGLGSSYEYVYPSPHFHVLGVGHTVDNSAFKQYAKGWILSLVSAVKERLFVHRERHMLNIARYQLSHVSRLKINPDSSYNTLAVTYFGLFSYNKVIVDEIFLVTEVLSCESCSGPMHLCGYVDDPRLYGHELGIDWDNDLGEYLQKRRIKKYKLRSI